MLLLERYLIKLRLKYQSNLQTILQAEKSLPPEPSMNGENVTKIRFRKPSGEFFERRFIVDTKLKILLNFATANGFLVDEFKIISSFPRRDVSGYLIE